MNNLPDTKFTIAFGLSCDVQKDPEKKSGYRPAPIDLGSKTSMFGYPRLDGFAALLRINFAKRLILVGGNEGRYAGEDPPVNRAQKIRDMLVHDHGCDSSRILALASNSNTGGNIDIIRNVMREEDLAAQGCAVVTSWYHAPRAHNMLFLAGVSCPVFSAEALWLMEDYSRKDALLEEMRRGDLVARMGEEVNGIGQLIDKTYVARTDVVPGQNFNKLV